MARKPYVISEDIHILLGKWTEQKGFQLPSMDFFEQLRIEMRKFLENIFGIGMVDMIPADELREGMEMILRMLGSPIVSMDRVYVPTEPDIQVARVVDEKLNDLGTQNRFKTPLIKTQISEVRRKYRKVVLVDDVLFSGKVMVEIIDLLRAKGVDVPVVVVGIAIGEGLERVRLETSSEVIAVRSYAEVTDEICERDFYPGVPLCGRLVSNPFIERGAPYLHPFGKPKEWASVPHGKTLEFSEFCLRQSVKLWEEIEKASGRPPYCYELERIPIGIEIKAERFVDALKHSIATVASTPF